MKSETLAPDRVKVEGRQSTRRRRMSKATSATTNGDVQADGDSDCSAREVNMVAAIQDHISCTKSAELLKNQEAREEKITLPCELDHMYANCGEPRPSQEESQQIKKLRELLLLHLNLIQQQEEQLRAKDRLLATLKQEKDSMKQKLERMERRVAFIKQKEKLQADRQQISDSIYSEKEEKNDLRTEPSSLQNDKQVRTTRDKRMRRKSGTERGADLVSHPRLSTGPRLNSNDTNDNRYALRHHFEGGKDNDDMQLDSVHRTELNCYFNSGFSVRSLDSPARDEEVMVPSWRLHPVTSCYAMEGTENLDDEIFLKRHQKLEIDERRRKRWDIQRIREQRQNEKLKRGRCKNSEQNASQEFVATHSFCPNPEDAMYLEVCDTVPVCAFGFPVPNFQPCEFSLPWSITENKVKSEKEDKQKTPGTSSKKARTSDTKRGS